jgi:cytochrome P450
MIEEALRVESPVQWVPRRVTQDVELRGVRIPAGSWVLLGWGAGNRDPERWTDADEFDIEREAPEKHIAFGHGPHFCLGAPLARLEGRIAFEKIFDRMANIRLAPDAGLTHFDSPSFRGLRRLDIEFDKV